MAMALATTLLPPYNTTDTTATTSTTGATTGFRRQQTSGLWKRRQYPPAGIRRTRWTDQATRVYKIKNENAEQRFCILSYSDTSIQSSLSSMKISSTGFSKICAIFNANTVDGTNLPLSMALIV